MSQRVTDEDGHVVEVFPLPTDEATLERVLRDLFELHWDKIVFGPIIQCPAWEFQAPHAPTHVGVPTSWGLRLWNGYGEQQATIVFPNPFLSADSTKVLREPDWWRLALWDEVRLRYVGIQGPDPVDRSGTGFRHD